MPRRWLSFRGSHGEEKTCSGGCEGFDFAFNKTDIPNQVLEVPESTRPYTSAGDRHRARRKPDLTLLIERPSDRRSSLRQNTPRSAGALESPHIGIAYGSPLHPPHNFSASDSIMTPSRNCFVEHSSPLRSPSIRKWKKLGELFRPKADDDTNLSAQQPPNTVTELHKTRLPSYRDRWRNIRSDAAPQSIPRDRTAISHDQLRDAKAMEIYQLDPANLEEFFEAEPVPVLRVKIPGSPLERYSVMFKNFTLNSQRDGLTTRKIVQRPISDDLPHHQGLPDEVLTLRRRITSPTATDIVERPRTASSQTMAHTRYSLFPNTPMSSRPQSQHRPSSQAVSRPSTAPAQAIPLPEGFPSPPTNLFPDRRSDSPTKLEGQIRKKVPSPTPLATLEVGDGSGQSRGSSVGEIFFDVKSFRGSRGQDTDQYEMTRPPSAELQLARTKSNARKKVHRKSAGTSAQSEAVEERTMKSTSVEIDETIALVESLISSASSLVSSQETEDQATPVTGVSNHTTNTSPSNTANIAVKRTRKSSNSKLEGLNVTVPARTLESIEEVTPRIVEPMPQKLPALQSSTAGALNHIASETRANSNVHQVPHTRIMHEKSPPPAVPVKESKLIPISRYAPEQTTKTLIQHTGLRPVRPTRSNTDGSASYNSRLQPRQATGRSYTIPNPNYRQSVQQSLSQPVRTGPEEGREMPMVVAYVKPAAEVSIARTVSLARRPSAKITVSRQSSRKDSESMHRSQKDVHERTVVEKLPSVDETQARFQVMTESG